jgi:hypothetical protein
VTVLKKKFSAVKEKKIVGHCFEHGLQCSKKEGTIKVDLQETGWWEVGGWTELVWLRLGAKSIP